MDTTTRNRKDFRDDDGDDDRYEVFEQTLPTAEGYAGLFDRLAQRAYKHGFSSVTVLSWHDPMSGFSFSMGIMTGNHYQNIGAARAYVRMKENEG